MLLTVYWLLYFALHSLLASLFLKRLVAQHYSTLMPWYRLAYNFVATLLILPGLYLTFFLPGDPLWIWSGLWRWLSLGLTVLAIAGFFYSLKFYDSSEFIGFRQLREQEKKVEDQERFHLSPLHYYVRHPWYFLGLVLIWTRDMPPAMLLTSIAMTVYFILGSQLEERKLLQYHGKLYADYRKLVPSIFPLPWRYLSRADAEQLLENSR